MTREHKVEHEHCFRRPDGCWGTIGNWASEGGYVVTASICDCGVVKETYLREGTHSTGVGRSHWSDPRRGQHTKFDCTRSILARTDYSDESWSADGDVGLRTRRIETERYYDQELPCEEAT